MVGVGASCLDYALAGRLAAALGERLRRPVAWQALGENGITSGEARERLLPQVAGRFFDQVILVSASMTPPACAPSNAGVPTARP